MDTPAATTDHESASKMTDEAEAAKNGPMKVDSLQIDVAENGGYVVRVSRRPEKTGDMMGPGYDSKTYAVGSREELDDVLDDVLGAGDESGEAADAGAGDAGNAETGEV